MEQNGIWNKDHSNALILIIYFLFISIQISTLFPGTSACVNTAGYPTKL